MKNNLFLFFIGLMFASTLMAQSPPKTEKFRLSGYVYDHSSKETLLGANIYDLENLNNGATTNNYGFFSLQLEKGKHIIIISYVGYEKLMTEIDISQDTSVAIYLRHSSMLDEIVIYGEDENKRFIEEAIPGKITIDPSVILALPSLTGESDLLKSLQLLPGVKSGTDGTTGLYVRGGNVDQNLYLIDGNPIYNPNHLLGFISTFNTDAIKTIDFYKGGFNARYGERVSSVVDIWMKDGNSENLQGDLSIGLISAKLNLEGPIVKDRTTFNISARRTYLDLLLKPIISYENARSGDGDVDFGYYFSDINFKVNHSINKKNRIISSLYWGLDKYYFSFESKYSYHYDGSYDYYEDKTKMNVSWGNLIGNITWIYELNNQLFGNLTLSYNRYQSDISTLFHQKSISQNLSYESRFRFNFFSGIEDYSIKNEYNYYLNGWNKINFGVNYTNHFFTPEQTSIKDEDGNFTGFDYELNNNLRGDELIAYIEDEMNFTERFSMYPGLHFNLFSVGNKNYYSLQPRFSFRYTLMKDLSLKGGYSLMSQNIHLLANGIFSMPTDLWVPVTEKIKPITSNQISGGLFYNLKNWANLSLEAYYKKLDNIIDYKDGVSAMNNSENWEYKVSQGFGEAYGLEFFAQKNQGNTTGWFSYTLSWAFREFPEGDINAGMRYYDRYDSRNQFNITIIHKFSDKLDVSASWVYNTGNRISMPIATYHVPDIETEYWDIVEVYGERNNLKLPDYHRLDIGINRHNENKWGRHTWSFNVFNLYNRKNPVFVVESPAPNKLTAYSLMPFIATVSYTFKFKIPK